MLHLGHVSDVGHADGHADALVEIERQKLPFDEITFTASRSFIFAYSQGHFYIIGVQGKGTRSRKWTHLMALSIFPCRSLNDSGSYFDTLLCVL